MRTLKTKKPTGNGRPKGVERMNKRFELSMDHPSLVGAKIALDKCLMAMVNKAVETRSMEGTATLKINMEILDVLNDETNEWEKKPSIKFKVGWSVPIKANAEGKLMDICDGQLVRNPDGKWCLINNQVSIDELIGGEDT